jgi:hypothetical protein
MIPHCLDSRLTDGGKVVSLTHPPHFTPKNMIIFMFLVLISVSFSKSEGLVRPEGLGKFKKITSSSFEPATFRFVA